MDKPFWRDVDNYIRNSPINGMDKLKTPLLVAFGDKDGAVDFSQGVEMYNAARRAEKDNFVMLVYPGENHGLAQEENMVDYHYRIIEWLAHYLKGDKAPKWITDGQTWLERKAELETRKKARKVAEKPPVKEP
jgi:dipeptidyl aminopeptidase/acylaminoacyl peptidase